MPAGRPTEYRQQFAEQAATLALNGATDDEIADDIGVSVRTVMRWYNKHPEFRQAVRYGKAQADEKVERSLYHRAVGFEMDTVKIGFYEGNAVMVEHREYYPPDPGSAKLWLTNRKPDEWREKQELAVTGELTLASRLKEARQNAERARE
jgi:hypothetical protein